MCESTNEFGEYECFDEFYSREEKDYVIACATEVLQYHDCIRDRRTLAYNVISMIESREMLYPILEDISSNEINRIIMWECGEGRKFRNEIVGDEYPNDFIIMNE